MAFEPKQYPLRACLDIVDELKAQAKIGKNTVYTSKDFPDLWANKKAHRDSSPAGFQKIILPFIVEGTITFYLSTAGPNTPVPGHAHQDGDGGRLIVAGSIKYRGQELVAGDWMYVPANAGYDFQAGPTGVTILAWYTCCC